MKPKVKIRACRTCALDRKKLRRALRDVLREHGDAVVVRKRDCLDLCERKPVLVVNGRRLAPASAKRLRRVVEDLL